MQLPNLFSFATGELSQDAFICWLASWADPACQDSDGPLHQAATAFIDRLLEVGMRPKPPAYRSIKVWRQKKHIDVLIEVNGDTAIIVEDKTNSKDPSKKLQRYKRVVAKRFPEDRIAAVYLKTGDQCDYESANQAGYGCFLRHDFLGILQHGERLGVKNAIFADFHRYLLTIEQAVKSFPVVPVDTWRRKQWIGFFMALRERFADGEWDIRGHSGGSTPGFRWHWRADKFLLLNEGILCFKIEVKDKAEQKAKWAEWKRKLVGKDGTAGLSIRASRRKLGKRMTVATLCGDYLQRDERGLLDMGRTVQVLNKAEEVMDAALAEPSAGS